ncbi:MAG: uracil-DNA glycosylase, partial [Proteobacteria bacterium]|nr:uracil-DNA glycosylase [Pseudomonadota bacterium]
MSAHEELAELVADVKAVLQDYRVRGALDLPAEGSWEPDEVSTVETMEQIQAELGDCQRCGLCGERNNIVFGGGDSQADLVVVGEAPGFQEDRQGEPFVGPAGEMLDKMLLHVLGLPRDRVY